MAAGFRSALPQLGYSAPLSQAGFRGLLAFWIGGACIGPAVEPPAPPPVNAGGPIRELVRKPRIEERKPISRAPRPEELPRRLIEELARAEAPIEIPRALPAPPVFTAPPIERLAPLAAVGVSAGRRVTAQRAFAQFPRQAQTLTLMAIPVAAAQFVSEVSLAAAYESAKASAEAEKALRLKERKNRAAILVALLLSQQ